MELDIAKKKALALATAKFKLNKVNQQSALTELASGPQPIKREPAQFGVSGKRPSKAQKPDALGFYQEHVPNALMVSKDEVDLTKGAPVGLRAGYDFLPTMSDKALALKSKFGEDNVKSLNVAGNPSLLYKDEGKWRFFDLPFGVEFADVTSDLAGDVAPTVASIAAAIPAAVTTPIGMAAAGGVANFAVGSMQDYAARKAFGIEANKMEIAKRRGVDSVLSGGMDYGLMKGVGALAKGVLRKEGVDLATQQLKAIEDKIKLPAVMKQGEDGVSKVTESAEIYKDGTAAKFLEGVRDQVNWQFTGEQVDPEPIKKFTADIIKLKIAEAEKLEKSASAALEAINKKRASMVNIPEATKLAKKEAAEVFNKIVQKEVDKVAIPSVSPAKIGKKLQDLVSENYVKVEANKIKKYENAFELLKDQKVGGFEVRRIFQNQTKGSVVDAEDEIISMLASPAVKMSDAVTVKLADVMDGELSFRNLNDIIRVVESKSGVSKTGKNVNEAAYSTLTNELKGLRDEVLDRSGPDAKAAFEDAQNYMKDVVVKYRQGGVGTAIKTEAGETYKDAINAAYTGQKPVLPTRLTDPSSVISKALSSPTEVKNFIRATDESLEAKVLMRSEFLASKGIVKGQPIRKGDLNFTRDEIDIIDVLWPKKERGGYNRKYQTLKKIQKLASEEDEFIDGLTSETISKLVSQNTDVAEREILKLATEEKLLREKQKKITSNFLVKMWGNGEIPLPTNQTTMETFMGGIRKSKQSEQEAFFGTLKEAGKNEMFERAVVNDLVARSKAASDYPQMGSAGSVMWDQKAMSNILKKEKQFLSRFLGKDKYENLVKWNNALKWVSTKSKEERGIGLSATTDLGKVKLFINNLAGSVANRFKAALIHTQLKSPIPLRIVMSPEQHDKWMERIIQSTFITDQGVEAIINESEADPEFKAWATEFYKDAATSN